MAGSQDHWVPRWMLALALALLVGVVIYTLRGALTPVLFAFLIAYLLDPVVDRFEARGLPRAVGIAIMLGLVLGALGLFLLLVVPVAVRDALAFASELPGRLEATATRFEQQYGIDVPHSFEEVLGQLALDGSQLAGAAVPASAAVAWVLGGTMSILGATAGVLFVPVFAAYLLHDFDRIVASARELLPPGWRPYVVELAREVDTVLGEFVRGQLLVMTILAVLYSVAYALLGVRLAVPIGVVAGLLSFIPYVGAAIALGLALLMCVIDGPSVWSIGGVTLAYAVIQTVEGFVITPRIVGEKVGLSAVWVLFALLVGGESFGFFGVLVALPVAAVAKIFVTRGLGWYRSTAFFRDGAPPPGLAAALADTPPRETHDHNASAEDPSDP